MLGGLVEEYNSAIGQILGLAKLRQGADFGISKVNSGIHALFIELAFTGLR
jgi:hypothetical protein